MREVDIYTFCPGLHRKRLITFAVTALRVIAAWSISFLPPGIGSGLCKEQNHIVASDWEKSCELAKKTPLPQQDRPNPAQRKDLKGCVSQDLYYGIGRQPDPTKARLCAYLELEIKRQSIDELVFGREAMLMMVYANGKGTARNFDVALKFACELADDASNTEMSSRIERLQELKEERWTGNDFDLCDDASSSFMKGQCATLYETIDAIKRRRRLDTLETRWNNNVRTVFQQLQQAASHFFTARAENELDLSGNGATEIYASEITSLNDSFVEDLERFEKGNPPRFSARDFMAADRELNSVYSAIKKSDNIDEPSVAMEGIRKTELAWIRYRDAWVAFGQCRYSGVSADSWKTWLTRERIKMLREFIL
jgi:uncharacterized protein YecT (DUF1311 family)